MNVLRQQEDVLLNMRLLGEIEPEAYSAKATELRDRVAKLKLRFDACDRGSDETGDFASKAFELSQRLEREVGYRRTHRKAVNPRNALFELEARRRKSCV